MRILLLEDDDALRKRVAAALRRRGDAVDEAAGLNAADEKLFVFDYDVAVLDRSVPGGDAAALVRRARAEGLRTPILLLTALDGVADRVAGLDSGADDYLVKPFALAELLARVRSLGRRSSHVDDPILLGGGVELDTADVTAHRWGRPMTLTPKEFAMLTYLMRSTGRVVTRTELLEHCWDEHADPRSNVVDVRIGLLRAKLGEPDVLHTVRGVGFRFQP